ncbi:unnamed protein product [Dibothriocephalus latus]|uniref:Uncharacterized protein n=1 Tax=Dibothriocephalus latus TaxID=60516 RepID=A0A3P7PN05_DIBLA|nr:unnamed protein product [Dibothriocephalus latus]
MANFSHFEAKENYMRFMNDFVLAMTDEMRGFLRAVSTTGGGTDVDRDIWIKRTTATYNCHGCIDLGYELTMMHKSCRPSWKTIRMLVLILIYKRTIHQEYEIKY